MITRTFAVFKQYKSHISKILTTYNCNAYLTTWTEGKGDRLGGCNSKTAVKMKRLGCFLLDFKVTLFENV